jgi:hypothetical protein
MQAEGQKVGTGKNYWQAIRDLTAYADFLRRGGAKDSSVGVRLRGLAFPEGANVTTLAAMHAELPPELPPTAVRLVTRTTGRRGPKARETPAERRRRLAAEVLKAA